MAKKKKGFSNVVQRVWKEKIGYRDIWSAVKKKLKNSQHACNQWRKVHSDPTEHMIMQKSSLLSNLQGRRGWDEHGASA
jgi:hypothetical protein